MSASKRARTSEKARGGAPRKSRPLATRTKNARIRPHKPFLDVSDEDWERVRNVVLDGAFYLTRALIGEMVKNKYGRVLFFCGDGSISARGTGRAHLSAAKMEIGRAACRER